MKIGFIGFGEVAYTMASRLLDEGVKVLTSVRGRSGRTRKLARELGVIECRDNRKVSMESDITISAVTPSAAIKVAEGVGDCVSGVYVDINSVTPSVVKEALANIVNGRVVDAAIMGSVRREGFKVKILACGEAAEEFIKLNDYGFNIELWGKTVGDASALKMLRSSYTKGVSALLWETLFAAYQIGLDKEIIRLLEETEGEGFGETAKSRIISSAIHSKRRYEEVENVESFLSENINPLMSKCTKKVFRRIYKQLNGGSVHEDYEKIFADINPHL